MRGDGWGHMKERKLENIIKTEDNEIAFVLDSRGESR